MVFILSNLIPATSNADTVTQPDINRAGDNPVTSSNSEQSNVSELSLGGNTGRWFVVDGVTKYSNPTINVPKDSATPITFSKYLSQNSGSSGSFSQKVLFSDSIKMQALPEIIVPSGTTYTIQYSVDKVTFTSTPPADITDLKGIEVVFSKLATSERVVIKNTATVVWDKTYSGSNDFAQFYEDGALSASIYYDSYHIVKVKHLDDSGVDIAPPTILYGSVGQNYSTSELTIPGYQVITYPLNATGQFKDQDTNVTYVYARSMGAAVNIEYVDTEGNEIASKDIMTDRYGLPYEAFPKEIDGWKLKQTPENVTGFYTDSEQTVKFVYERAEASPITVEYLDEEGNDLAPKDVITGKVGLPYETTPKEISGWILKSSPENASGIFTDQSQTVSYIYDRNPDQTSLIVHDSELTVGDIWNAEDNFDRATDYYGQPIPFSDITVEGQVNTEKAGTYKVTYTRFVPNFFSNNENKGTYSAIATITVNDPKSIKGADVITRYVDTEGKKISDDVVKTGNIGEEYTTEQKDIKGYTFEKVTGSTAGKFTDQAQTIIYVYSKNIVRGADVTIKYLDKNGNKISDDDIKIGNVGEKYATIPKTIKGYTLMQHNGQTSGTYSEQPQNVIYIYEKNKTQYGHQENIKSDKKNQESNVASSLPKTGESQIDTTAGLGTLILILFGLIVIKRGYVD